ncbi:MAG: hypothetical protein AAGB18_07270 [Pseudomonadota bacterium]
MRWQRLTVCAGVLAAATHVNAEESDGFNVLTSALTLWEVALQEERADLAIAALEVVTRLSPLGADSWIDDAQIETRLLALGDRGILERVSALSLAPSAANLGILVANGEGAIVTMPADARLGRLWGPVGAGHTVATDATGQRCTSDGSPVLDCGDAGLTDEVRVIGDPGLYAYEVTSIDEGAEK